MLDREKLGGDGRGGDDTTVVAVQLDEDEEHIFDS